MAVHRAGEDRQHRTDWKTWWPSGYDIKLDPDLDGVPISVENAEPGCSNFSKNHLRGPACKRKELSLSYVIFDEGQEENGAAFKVGTF